MDRAHSTHRTGKKYIQNFSWRGPRHKQEDNIEMNFKEIGCWDVKWICLAQDKFQWQAAVKILMSLCVP